MSATARTKTIKKLIPPTSVSEVFKLSKNEIDKLTGKKFLITEIKHTISKNKESASPFFTAITIERNTYGNYKNYLKSEG